MSCHTRVIFLSNDFEVVGNLYAPTVGAPDRRGAAIIVGHPYTGVKEQTAGFYAEYCAKNGFYALAFDATYQGESSGEPRGLEYPAQRVEDFKSAASYLTTLKGLVDPERIGVLGICGSGGYVCSAAQSDVRIKAAVSLVPYCVGRAARNGGPNEEDKPNSAAIAGMLKFSADTRNAISQGNKVEAVEFRPKSVEEIPADMGSFMRKGTHYYLGTGFHPRSTGKVHPKSWDLMINYDSFALNNLISPRPLLVIGCEDAETLHFAKEAYEAALEPKEIFIVPSKGHFDIYQDASVAGPKTVQFLEKHLCGA
ncbi:Uncharacterized protein Focb16_v003163 [Fusarium oxysporum f. sp. cubense]|uniref:Dienelactone hydrolase domain-containing protein n=1 Tax=Fusarium oxysporum f. sp. cubense TaxID=61366 RepID=A0A559KKM7_FUSOC|nr:Uncharacterized protein Focb16_v003163 [Fusarium oxysporum f. sp. cubense]